DRGTRRFPTTKQVQHYEESCIVENRTDRTDKQDKLGNLTNLPTAWFRGLLWPNVIGRNRNLRKVIQEIVREHLQGRHRHKRQEGTRTKYTEHVAKVGTCSHANVFEDIHENLPAFN